MLDDDFIKSIFSFPDYKKVMEFLVFLSNSFLNLSHEKISGQIHLLVSIFVTGWMFQTINLYPRPEGLLIFYCEAVTPSAHLQLHVTRGGAVIYTHVCGFCASVLNQNKHCVHGALHQWGTVSFGFHGRILSHFHITPWVLLWVWVFFILVVNFGKVPFLQTSLGKLAL